MCRRWMVPVVFFLLLVSGTNAPIAAQDDGQACPALVTAALQAAETHCADLARNTACYGHAQVEATFLEPGADLAFDTPADLVPLESLHSLHATAYDPAGETWGVALIHTQASLPETLPGQAVTLLLMGDTTLENAITPDDGLAPMQAVYFSAGLGATACHEAPNALIVHTPQGQNVTLRVNDLDVQFGSTAVLTLAEVPGSAHPALVIALLYGHLTTMVGVAPVDLVQPVRNAPEALPALAITLNAQGRVDAASQIVAPPAEALAPVVAAACENAVLAGINAINRAACDTPLAPYGPLTVPAPAAPEPGVESDAETSPAASYIFDVGTCESGRRGPVDDFKPGDGVTIYQGCRWPTRAEADAAAAAGNGFIRMDGATMGVSFGWVRYLEAEPQYDIPAGWEASVQTTWIATPGSHSVQGQMALCGPHICSFEVRNSD